MTTRQAAGEGGAATERRLTAWLEANIGGKVTALKRQERWRPAWFVAMDHPGGPRRLYVRGERPEKTLPLPFEAEFGVLQVLERHGIPVPHVHGLCPNPRAIVMDEAPGRPDLSTAESEAERLAVLDQVMEIMARMHAIDAAEFEAVGLERPTEPTAIALNLFEAFVGLYREAKSRPEPILEFLIAWVRRNVPARRDRVSLVWGDPAQFLFQNGRVTAILDFELAYLGDPAHDLAGVPLRDTVEPLGDLGRAMRRYMQARGEETEPDVFDYYQVEWAVCTPLSLLGTVTQPLPQGSLLQYLEWFVNCCRAALEIMAKRADIRLEPLDLPRFRETRTRSMGEGLVGAIHNIPVEGDFARYERESAARLATYLRVVAEKGPAFERQDVADAEALLGAVLDGWQEADAALEQFVLSAGPGADRVLIPLLYRRVQRQAALLEPVLSRPEVARPARTLRELLAG